MTKDDPLALVGTTVAEKYEVEGVVGEGGFAVVYRARHMLWDRPVAIKVFRALGDLPSDQRAQLVESFVQEGRLLAELSERSAAICQARDIGTLVVSDGRELPYMVLEWLEGRTLEQVVAAERTARVRPRTPEEALRLLEPAAEALALAHRKGIAHRDVKPANLFIVGDPRGEHTVKLLDFGIAKVVQDAQRIGSSFAQTQGVVSSFTPAYGAAEQFSRTYGATGPWTDVFALALIFTELVIGGPALRGDDLTQLAFAAMDPSRRPTPRAYGLPVSEAVERVLAQALAVMPGERFPSAGDFWVALRAAVFPNGASRSFGAEPWRSQRDPRLTASPGSVTHLSHAPTMVESAVHSAQTMASALAPPSVNPTRATPQSSRSALPFVVAGGLALVVLTGAGLWALKSARQRPPPPSSPVASGAASAVASVAAAPVAPTPTPTPTCPPGMKLIPGGKFFMGSDDKKDEEHERPAHQVTLSPYCMDVTEVTVAQYKACSDRGECRRAPKENEWAGMTARDRKLYDPLCNIREPEARASYPINCIDWQLADEFCRAVHKRLPTEAEWEFATRGSDGRKYPWGDAAPTSGGFLNACGTECVAWGKKHPDPDNPLVAMYPSDDGFATTAPVGSFPSGASPFGLVDVVGNVWEWVNDWYAPYGPEPLTNPAGPTDGSERVLRGGAWNGSDPAWVRPTYRFKLDSKLRSHGIGVRCAKGL